MHDAEKPFAGILATSRPDQQAPNSESVALQIAHISDLLGSTRRERHAFLTDEARNQIADELVTHLADNLACLNGEDARSIANQIRNRLGSALGGWVAK